MINYEIFLTNPLFKGIEISVIKKLLQNFTLQKYTKNTTIFIEKDKVDNIYIILNGSIEITKYDLDGTKNIVTILSDYEMFAESVSLSNHQISPYTVTTLNKCEIISINVDDFRKLSMFNSNILINMLDILANKNTFLTFKIDCISKRTIKERVFEVLRYYYVKDNTLSIKLPYNRTQLAEFLCLNRSSLTRELSKMEEEGIFNYKNSYYNLNKKYFK